MLPQDTPAIYSSHTLVPAVQYCAFKLLVIKSITKDRKKDLIRFFINVR